jgi:DNA-binding SARP family transcriptional activator
MLHVRCLGAFAFRSDGGWNYGPSFKRGRELLQYLATYPRAAASRETLAEAFWPELDADAVRHRVHLAVAGARAALRAVVPAVDAICCNGGSYAWHPGLSVDTDYAEFFACDREGTTDALRRGIGLYSGEYCAGESAEWMHPMRVRASSMYVSMLERLAADAVAHCDNAAALEFGLQLVEADRGHEGATRLVMRALAALGRRAAAVAEYDALTRWLRRHLNVTPSRATAALREEIASGG